VSTTRATHHAKSSEPTVQLSKRKLERVLQYHDSRDRAISANELAQMVPIKATTVRDCIHELRSEASLPIVACSQGYYLISDPDELERELDRIEDEIQTREETKRELCAAFNDYTL